MENWNRWNEKKRKKYCKKRESRIIDPNVHSIQVTKPQCWRLDALFVLEILVPDMILWKDPYNFILFHFILFFVCFERFMWQRSMQNNWFNTILLLSSPPKTEMTWNRLFFKNEKRASFCVCITIENDLSVYLSVHQVHVKIRFNFTKLQWRRKRRKKRWFWIDNSFILSLKSLRISLKNTK